MMDNKQLQRLQTQVGMLNGYLDDQGDEPLITLRVAWLRDMAHLTQEIINRSTSGVTGEMAQFFQMVTNEIIHSTVKWPNNDVLHRLAALTGEVGELAEGYLKGVSTHSLTREAAQVAAMAYRVVWAMKNE
jgi:hypothetical protein